jgi:hypothetical protein
VLPVPVVVVPPLPLELLLQPVSAAAVAAAPAPARNVRRERAFSTKESSVFTMRLLMVCDDRALWTRELAT